MNEKIPIITEVMMCVATNPLNPKETTDQFMKYMYHHVWLLPVKNPGTKKIIKSLKITVAPRAKKPDRRSAISFLSFDRMSGRKRNKRMPMVTQIIEHNMIKRME